MRRLTLWFIGLGMVLVGCQAEQAPPGGGQNRTPTATFTASSLQGTAPLNVSFDASGSVDPDGVIASASWNFGDGGTASGMTVSHTFDNPGTFTVRLTVTDNRGATASAERVITTTGADGNLPPVASFTAKPSEGAAPLSVSFDASASADADGGIAAYSWTFGDGSSGTGVSSSHTYDSVGTYTVILSVTDDGGATASAEREVVVTDGGTSGGDSQEVQATGATFAMAELTSTLPDTYIAGAVDAALIASQLVGSGTLVVSGTVTQTGQNSFSYDPAPSDRLRAVFADGREFDIAFSELQGDFSGDGDRFVTNDHRAALHVSSNAAAGSLDLDLQSVKVNGEQGRLIQGALTDTNGVRWAVNVQTVGTYVSEADFDTARHESEDLVQGTLQADALGVSVTLNKRYRYKMLNGVENILHEIDHLWTWNGSEYRLQLEVFVAFDEAQPVDTDQWIIQGGLARDGVVIGQVRAADDPTGLEIWLELAAERIPLFRFSYL